MSVRLAKPFRASAERVRAELKGLDRERLLFDLICSAGELAHRFPDSDGNLKDVSGSKDPRRRLARDFPLGRGAKESARSDPWEPAARRLVNVIETELSARGDGKSRPLRVLLGYAPAGLAPDCVVPGDPLLRAAWKAVVRVFARLFPTEVKPLGRLACISRSRLAELRREAAEGLAIGRAASGQRPGPEGRELAVDRSLLALVGDAIGKSLTPAYSAKYLFYAAPGDHIWPHSDDPKYPVTCLICLDRQTSPGRAAGSAFLGFRPDGSRERHELRPGYALAFDSGLVHAREPVRAGERVVLLSVLYC